MDRGGGLAARPAWQRAGRFYIVNQLAFSGMRRFNRPGEFNVPFGHYRTFDASRLRSAAHAQLLRRRRQQNGVESRGLRGTDPGAHPRPHILWVGGGGQALRRRPPTLPTWQAPCSRPTASASPRGRRAAPGVRGGCRLSS